MVLTAIIVVIPPPIMHVQPGEHLPGWFAPVMLGMLSLAVIMAGWFLIEGIRDWWAYRSVRRWRRREWERRR